jgi:hypothetical protein
VGGGDYVADVCLVGGWVGGGEKGEGLFVAMALKLAYSNRKDREYVYPVQ